MSRKYYIVILTIIVLILGSWAYVNFNDNSTEYIEEQKFEYPKIKISSLPQKVQSSLEKLKERIATQNKFTLGFGSLLAEDIITPEMVLILEVEQDSYFVEMPESFIGLAAHQLAADMENWQIKNFEQDFKLVLEEKDYPYFLGHDRGRVVIFEKAEGQSKLVQKTELVVDNLPEKEQQALAEGINVNSEEELFAILEGLLSYEYD